MDRRVLRERARERLKGYCAVCPTCAGYACAGKVPGMGGVGTGSAFKANIEALARHRIILRTIHDIKKPETSIKLWGENLSIPVLAAPLTGVSYNMGGKMTETEFIEEIIGGSSQSGTIGMTGDGADSVMYDSGVRAIAANEGKGVAIIKPREQDEIIKRIRHAEAANILAVGMDIDGAGLITMASKGQAVSPKTRNEIKELIAATDLPFVIKGVMTPIEAEIAVECGAAAIVVSNHGGRILDYTPGAADVLPEIASKVKGEIIIFADGGVRAGVDVLKLLALGADVVLVGRPLVVGAFGGGRSGVSFILNSIKDELIQAMLLTETADVKRVSRGILTTAY
ncbi:alpha-hydroxy-acid oxidizing protein [Thermodesulfovibrionales bacterium]|nr:alpha-hydroxy-acid oxidizing protein [Thermodesulfovibrionales bacterium]